MIILSAAYTPVCNCASGCCFYEILELQFFVSPEKFSQVDLRGLVNEPGIFRLLIPIFISLFRAIC